MAALLNLDSHWLSGALNVPEANIQHETAHCHVLITQIIAPLLFLYQTKPGINLQSLTPSMHTVIFFFL